LGSCIFVEKRFVIENFQESIFLSSASGWRIADRFGGFRFPF
jgi:hypothetical protein